MENLRGKTFKFEKGSKMDDPNKCLKSVTSQVVLNYNYKSYISLKFSKELLQLDTVRHGAVMTIRVPQRTLQSFNKNSRIFRSPHAAIFPYAVKQANYIIVKAHKIFALSTNNTLEFWDVRLPCQIGFTGHQHSHGILRL